ncbi:MAG: polysaccharide deacetylase [Selenomonadaceae bacterium]|nr:polysaccharide deacetylase [Selenomonadaceae bacterium]
MKKIFCLFLILIFCAGCGTENTENKNSEPEPIKKTVEEQAKEMAAEGKFILAAEDFSNLQLTDVDKPVYDALGVWDRQEKNLPMALPDITPYESESVVYLTFDDGPDDKITPQILDVLKQEEVKATFFVLGVNVETYPDVLKRIFNEGHAIGNHSYDHIYKKLYKSPWDFAQEMTKTDEIIQAYIGVRPLIIRAPGGVAGAFDANYWEMTRAMGYAEYDWNTSTEDATPQAPNASTQINNVLQQLGDNPPHTVILLMHSKDGKEETVKALPDLIHMFRDWGYKFGVITPMTPQPW